MEPDGSNTTRGSYEMYSSKELSSRIPKGIREDILHKIVLARELLEESGNLVPVAFLYNRGGKGLIVDMSPFMKEGPEKDIGAKILRQLGKEQKSEAVLILSEVWVGATRKADSWQDVPQPSEDPQREEAVSFMISTKKWGDWNGLGFIIREEGKPPTFKDVIWNGGEMKTEGRFTGLLREE